MDIGYGIAFLAAFVLTAVLGVAAVPLAKKYKARQSVRECGPKSHQSKSGTPTMGGLFMMLALVVTILADAFPMLPSGGVLLLLFLTLGHCLLGFLDDFIKAEKKRNLGLTAKQKLLGQLVLSLAFCYAATAIFGLPLSVSIPFVGGEWELGWLFYPFCVIVIVGASNAVNLTDGLDGLAAGCTAIAFLAYAVYAAFVGMHDIGHFSMMLAACAAAFLLYNYHPAKIFMGDTGSLALGGALAGIAVLTRTEFLLIFLGVIFVAEALSVILQVASFKLCGKRIFKMSPIHHHFELSGWSEVRVVWTFWVVELLAASLTLFFTI